MIAPLITKINTALNNVTELAFVYDFGVDEVEGYPAVVWTPITFTNQFYSTVENLKGYSFRIVIIAETEIKGDQSALHDVLIPAVDAVIAEFDATWNQGDDGDGHRIWWGLETGDWGLTTDTQDGTVYAAELTLTINQLTTN